MANISSYNQLSNWNEDDDLLFVQQPDAPKKAHPSQMKEYILEGLDVPSVGGTGKYISAISEADGKISATEETMDEVPTQNSNKPVKSGGVFSAIDDSVSLKTATGNPITLTDAANANAEKLLMTIEPVQSGSGDPSPTNVRPISGISEATVQTTNGEDTNTASITFGQTVYGGSVNFKTGEVTVTHKMMDLGTVTYYKFDVTQGTLFRCGVSDIKPIAESVVSDMLCSAYPTKSSLERTNISISQANNTPNVDIVDSRYTNTADFKQAMSGVQLCYELATPTTLTLTPAELELLKGNNTITANGAEISLKYYPDNAIGALAGRVDGKADITYVDDVVSGRAECFISSSANEAQSINIGVVDENRVFLFACGFHTNYVLELIAISANGANVVHVPVANSSINSISNISYNATTGVVAITVENNPFSHGRMTRLS